MRAACVTRAFDAATNTPGKVEVIDWPTPAISNDDEVLIRVAYASICGSDKHYIVDNLFPDPVPFVAGHEWSGVIEKLGPNAKAAGFSVGDRVTGNFLRECGWCDNCRAGKTQFCAQPDVRIGTQAEYVCFPYQNLYKLPDSVGLDVAALAEPFAIAISAIIKSGVKLGDSVFVIGAGSIGQMLIQLAKLEGASFIATSARTASKRELALQMGADCAIDPSACDVTEEAKHANGGKGYDVVFEASGNISCAMDAIELICPGGTAAYVSYYDFESILPLKIFPQIILKEATIKGLQMGQIGWPHSVRMLERVDLKPLISKVYDLEDAAQAYADLVEGKQLKILLKCS
ncbi:MAG: alcohol dehydrogenase catalytic domain-containing protein [bacterium]|nr:alcohol dehydrogenase catalytic domain-containing protein [bacterium]